MIKSFDKQIISTINVKDKVVLVRVDYNVPLEKNGSIADDKRIRSSLPTIQDLLDRGAKQIILLSHMGRPNGYDPNLSLLKVANCLAELIELPVAFEPDINFLRSSEKLVMFENLRFHSGEKANSLEFAQKIVDTTGADLFVQDGFSVCHRQTATTDQICTILPSYASEKVADEYQAIAEFVKNIKSPRLAILGGAKISDKIDFIKKLAEKSDYIVVGGALANIFLQADGIDIGSSLFEPNQQQIVQQIRQIAADKVLLLPEDVVVGDDLAYKSGEPRVVGNVAPQEMILDIGAKTQAKMRDLIAQAGSVIWNGNLGYTENPVFQFGTSMVVDALAEFKTPALIGGGDIVGFINQFDPDFNYDGLVVSTGGGAMLELVANETLVGIESLRTVKNKIK